MTNICLYFQIHQPYRLKRMNVFELGRNSKYFESQEDEGNFNVLKKVAAKSYRPMFGLLKSLVTEFKQFKFSLSISGTALEQMELVTPDLVTSLKEISNTGSVEYLGETYHHSLASLFSPTEFLYQVTRHTNKILTTFKQRPTIFRNTELIYTNRIAEMVKNMGFSGMLAEGADKVLQGRSPVYLYQAPCGLPLLLKHYLLSDDIAFRFSESGKNGKPLTAETFCHWINNNYKEDQTVNLFMDFETFGEHQWKDTGIFDFFYHFVKHFINQGGNFLTVSEAVKSRLPKDVFYSESPVSWADVDRGITAWKGNRLQDDALKKIYNLENKVLSTEDVLLVEDWRRLQTSDHYYYMCTKWSADGDVHAYFSPYKSPHYAYVNFGYALADINLRLKQHYG